MDLFSPDDAGFYKPSTVGQYKTISRTSWCLTKTENLLKYWTWQILEKTFVFCLTPEIKLGHCVTSVIWILMEKTLCPPQHFQQVDPPPSFSLFRLLCHEWSWNIHWLPGKGHNLWVRTDADLYPYTFWPQHQFLHLTWAQATELSLSLSFQQFSSCDCGHHGDKLVSPCFHFIYCRLWKHLSQSSVTPVFVFMFLN